MLYPLVLEEMEMGKRRLAVDWRRGDYGDFSGHLTKYKRHLEDLGFRSSTIDSYIGHTKRYLEFAGTDRPSAEVAAKFRDTLHERNLARSTINNYSFAIVNYHRMLGEAISFPYVKGNETLPYYFSQEDVLRIFDVCNNLKHFAMLQTLFYGCLRASELCNLDDKDLDLKRQTIYVREGKGGKDGIAYISDECARTIKRYLEIRPRMIIDSRQPLFYTDFGKRWDRRDVHRMFTYYKKKAGIEKAGGVHVFARHTAASILVANGCDLRHVKELMRHKDIRTTLRYAHVGEKTLREKYDACLKLV